jgi:hypothetical protein
MSNDPYMKMVETSLKFVGELGDQADQLAYAIQQLLEGGDPEDAAALLQKFGYTDKDGFWIAE